MLIIPVAAALFASGCAVLFGPLGVDSGAAEATGGARDRAQFAV
jgi:hypothetical protein